MLDFYIAPLDGSDLIRFQFDQQALAQGTLAQILWLQGLPDQAIRIAGSSVERARSHKHALTLCTALGQAACPVALLNGDLASAESLVETLLTESAEHALDSWHVWGRCFRGVLLIKCGDLVTGLGELRRAIAEVPESRLLPRQMALLGELANALGRAGEIGQGMALIDDTLARSEQRDERWCIAELLRIKGVLVTIQAAPSARATAERYFLQALDSARQQGALSWELRCAVSLARLWHEQGRAGQARELLGGVYGRFSEGFETADMKTSAALIATLR
jgi:predicted ATPase